ncbi:MAG: cell division protein FtsQ [Solirubrobacteraceae bacterium]|jgi:cell division protein FtsQ|nr:cell division protein FtsQ [Solirubrobacteraceae bacterium]
MARFARRRMRVVLIAAVLIAALVPLGLWLRDSSLVGVTDVEITGLEGPQASRVRAALEAAARDMTTLHVRDDVLLSAAEPYPIVHSVKASASFPHTLKIKVNAYEPVAAVQVGDSRTAVAPDGTLLRGSSTSGLPIVALRAMPGGSHLSPGPARSAVRLLAAAPPALRGRVERVVNASHNLIAIMNQGPKLYFGDGGRRQAKWAAAARVLADSRARGASYIDLRLPERPVAGGLVPSTDQASTSTLG